MSLRLKHEKGWFAAGAEVENALMTLSDGAFKLFVHLCLLAPRETGIIETSQTELARTLKKGNYTIRKYLQEMERSRVCRLSGFAPVPYSRGRIEITDEYWPYHRQKTPPKSTMAEGSVDQVRQLLQERSCVRACSLPPTRSWPVSGWMPAPPWSVSNRPFCWAVHASMWLGAIIMTRRPLPACATSNRCSRKSIV
jgi:hypothetical protein